MSQEHFAKRIDDGESMRLQYGDVSAQIKASKGELIVELTGDANTQVPQIALTYCDQAGRVATVAVFDKDFHKAKYFLGPNDELWVVGPREYAAVILRKSGLGYKYELCDTAQRNEADLANFVKSY